MTEFEGVVPPLRAALDKRGYDVLTPVQKAVLVPELKDADTLVSAQTGSGKTVAFGMSIAPTLLGDAERFQRARAPLALAVAPTRELALQVKSELEWLYEMTGASVASCVGGMDMRTERRVLDRGAHIVVGTPGRLRDHIERKSLDLSQLKAVILDEADEMLDMGFRDDLEFILGSAPTERRTLMFSATVPRPIVRLAKRYQQNAVRVTTTSEREQHGDIEYRAIAVAPNDRENAIINLLRYFEAKNSIVFCGTRAAVNRMTSRFNNRGFSVVALSGELSQNERTHALQALRDGRARVCIATDVAARGLDLPNVELVIHADLPTNAQTMLHRSGRTGRAGRKGVSALIVPHNWRKRVERMFREVNIDATWAKPPSVDDVMSRDDERLLADSTLTSPIEDNEKSIIEKLLAQQSPEQVAAAFVRQYRAGQSAPEDLMDTGPAEERPKRHAAFRESIWFSLTIGRSQNVEARWILPMLCRVGGITKNEIGKINIEQDETLVELTAASVDGFLKTVGPEMVVEDTIKITRMDNPPRSARPARSERPSRPHHEDRFNRSDRNARADGPGRKKSYKTRPSRSATTEDAPAAAEKFSDARPKPKPKTKSKPETKNKPEKKLKAKKRKKLKLAKIEAKSSSPSREAPVPGSAPMMRRKDSE